MMTVLEFFASVLEKILEKSESRLKSLEISQDVQLETLNFLSLLHKVRRSSRCSENKTRRDCLKSALYLRLKKLKYAQEVFMKSSEKFRDTQQRVVPFMVDKTRKPFSQLDTKKIE